MRIGEHVMKKIGTLLIGFILILRFIFLTPLACYSVENELTIPTDLSIPLVFKYPVTSSQISTGDNIQIAVNDDVYVDKTLIFKKGTEGVVFVDSSKKGRSWGRGGKIEITSGRITDVFGNEHSVKLSARAKGDSKSSGKILPIVSLVILWPLAFFGFKDGDDAVIPAGKLIYAFTTAPTIAKVPKQ